MTKEIRRPRPAAIRGLMSEKGHTVRTLIAGASISKGAAQNYTNDDYGGVFRDINIPIRIARFLGVSVDEISELVSSPPSNPPEFRAEDLRARHAQIVDVLVQQTYRRIHLRSRKVDLALTVSLTSRFEDIEREQFSSPPLTPTDFLNHLLGSSERLLLLSSAGGSGKTSFLYQLLKATAGRTEVLPFHLELTRLEQSPLSTLEAEIFLEPGAPMAWQEYIRTLAMVSHGLLLVDGLNEIDSHRGDQILTLLHEEMVRHHSLVIVVADRLNPRASHSKIPRATINRLTGELERLVPEPQLRSDLLSRPFFLDLFLELTNSRAPARDGAALIERYLAERIGLMDSELGPLPGVAMKAYGNYHGRTFEEAWWGENLPEHKWLIDKLRVSGVITSAAHELGGRASLRFSHQLFHDYFVGRWLAAPNRPPADWHYRSLDEATFGGVSSESLSFAVQILLEQDPGKCDRLLKGVYDWNYKAAFDCARSLRKNHATLPTPLEGFVRTMFAMTADKRFDIFEATADSARERLALVDNDGFVTRLQGASTKEAFWRQVGLEPKIRGYEEWQELFVRPSASGFREREIGWLIGDDSIMGWTAANVARRGQLADGLQLTLRQVFFALLDTHLAVTHRSDGTSPTAGYGRSLRWRIVHALGAYATKANTALLARALRDDPERWVKYGAVRGLMEHAFLRRKRRGFRMEIFELVRSNAKVIGGSRELIRELRNSKRIRGGAGGWEEEVESLVQAASVFEATNTTL